MDKSSRALFLRNRTFVAKKKTASTEDDSKARKQELEKLNKELGKLRDSIEEKERKFKNFLAMKRRFENIQVDKNVMEDPLAVDDLIGRSKAELERVKTMKQVQNEDKNKTDQEIERKLKQKIEDTKKWYSRRRSFVRSGPEFKMHSASPFGKIIQITALDEINLVCFSSGNMIEIWSKNSESQEFQLKEAFEIPGAEILCIEPVYSQDTSFDYDPLQGVQNSENYLASLKCKDNAGSNSEDFTRNSKNYNCIPKRPPRSPKVMYTVAELQRNASERISKGVLIDWDVYFLPDVPIVELRTVFFYGKSSGEAGILEILSYFNPIEKQFQFKAKIRVERAISCSPIKLCFAYFVNELCPLVIAEVSIKTNERYVEAFNVNLEMEWFCKVDMIRLSLNDRCTRYVSKEQLEKSLATDLLRSAGNIKLSLEEPLITAFAYDKIHSCILFGTSKGVVLRFFYLDAKELPNEYKSTSDFNKINKFTDTSSTPGKLVWCLEVTPYSPNAQELIELDDKIKDSNEHNEDVIHVENPIITSLDEMLHTVKNTSNILISASDGIIRIFPNDNLRCTPRPKLFFADRYLRNNHMQIPESLLKATITSQIRSGYICTNDGIQLVAGITSNNNLVVFDATEHNNLFLESQILNFAISSGIISQKITGIVPDHQSKLRILDNEKGLIAIYHGKYWSVISLERTIRWKMEDLITNGENPE